MPKKILIDQPSRWPTRKVWATIISGAITGAVISAIGVVWPDAPLDLLGGHIDQLVMGAVMAISAYMTRDAV